MIKKIAIVLAISGGLFIMFGSHNVMGESRVNSKAVNQSITTSKLCTDIKDSELTYVCPSGNENCQDNTSHQLNCINNESAWNCPNGNDSCITGQYHNNNCINNTWTCPNSHDNCTDNEYHQAHCLYKDSTWSCPNGDQTCDTYTSHQNHSVTHNGNKGHHGGRHH